MRRFFLILTIAVMLAVPAPAGAQDALYTLLSNYLDSLRTQTGIPGLAAAIVGQKGILWESAFGQADVDHAVPMRTDTPVHLGDLTQTVTATLALQCVESGRLSLSAPAGLFSPTSPDAGATIGQLLTHTSGSASSPVYAYNPGRLDPLAFALSACTGESSREMVAQLLDQEAMFGSVPGADAIDMVPPYEGVTAPEIERYAAVLKRLATPYAVDGKGHAAPSKYAETTLKPGSGLVSTVDDLGQFDVALKNGLLLKPETLASAWQTPIDAKGQPLPHGIGWFVQTYNGRQVVWQFGADAGASSSLMVWLPSQGLTLILLANSDAMVKPFGLEAGDVTASPFARVFLSTFAR